MLQSDAHIDLLVCDIGLPGLNGRQMAELARQGRPQLKVLFMTGYADEATRPGGFLGPGMQLVIKPFDTATLARRIQANLSPNPEPLARSPSDTSGLTPWPASVTMRRFGPPHPESS